MGAFLPGPTSGGGGGNNTVTYEVEYLGDLEEDGYYVSRFIIPAGTFVGDGGFGKGGGFASLANFLTSPDIGSNQFSFVWIARNVNGDTNKFSFYQGEGEAEADNVQGMLQLFSAAGVLTAVTMMPRDTEPQLGQFPDIVLDDDIEFISVIASASGSSPPPFEIESASGFAAQLTIWGASVTP